MQVEPAKNGDLQLVHDVFCGEFVTVIRLHNRCTKEPMAKLMEKPSIFSLKGHLPLKLCNKNINI